MPDQSPAPPAPQPTPLIWQADAQGRLQPYSPLFDDIYRSSGANGQGGLAQARHAFLMGCGLLAGDVAAQPLWQGQGQAQWHVLETGFGLGLNFLATWQAWRQDAQRPQRLVFSSLEAYPVTAQDMAQSAQPFGPEIQALAQELAQAWPPQPGLNVWQFEAGAVELHLHIADVLAALPQIQAPVDSVFLDGFNPKNNAAMWSDACFQALPRLMRSGSRLASWTAAGRVRQGLAQVGFGVGKRPGLPPKRESLFAHWP